MSGSGDQHTPFRAYAVQEEYSAPMTTDPPGGTHLPGISAPHLLRPGCCVLSNQTRSLVELILVNYYVEEERSVISLIYLVIGKFHGIFLVANYDSR